MKKQVTAHQRQSGTWEAKGVEPMTGSRKSYYGKTEAEAREKAERSFRLIAHDTLAGYYASGFVPTLSGRSQNWINQVAWAMERYVLPEFGETPLEAIDRRTAQAAFNRWSRTLKPSSLRRLRIVWSGVMNLAVDDEAIARNPLRRVRIPIGAAPEHVVLNPVQLWKLATECGELLRPIVLLQGFAGLRRGEACGTTWSLIEGGILQVRQQVNQPKGGAEVSKTLKTRQSKRDIPLPEPLIDALRGPGGPRGAFVCSNGSGGFLTPRAAYAILTRESVRLGLPKMGTHDLRHTFTSLLENEFEAPRRVVDAIIGRAGSGTTDAYSHTFNSQLARWMDVYWERVSTLGTTRLCRTADQKSG